jgi:hypothetical protein
LPARSTPRRPRGSITVLIGLRLLKDQLDRLNKGRHRRANLELLALRQ